MLVRVRAAGVNPYDTYMRNGTYAIMPPLPYTPGSDAAGDVEAIGEGVSNVKRSERVYTAKTLTGAYAEYALALEPKFIHFRRTLLMLKARLSGYRMALRTTRYISARGHAPEKLCSLTERAAA